MERLKNGCSVEFNIGGLNRDGLNHKGLIVGIALESNPILGVLYIIEPIDSDNSIKEYLNGYSHLACWEAHLKKNIKYV